MAKLLRSKTPIGQKRYPDTFQLYHRMANALKHSPYLMIPALYQSNLVPWPFALGDCTDAARGGPPAIQDNTSLKRRDVFGLRPALNFDVVSPGDGRGSGHQEIVQLAIVGEQHQAGGLIVQTP